MAVSIQSPGPMHVTPLQESEFINHSPSQQGPPKHRITHASHYDPQFFSSLYASLTFPSVLSYTLSNYVPETVGTGNMPNPTMFPPKFKSDGSLVTPGLKSMHSKTDMSSMPTSKSSKKGMHGMKGTKKKTSKDMKSTSTVDKQNRITTVIFTTGPIRGKGKAGKPKETGVGMSGNNGMGMGGNGGRASATQSKMGGASSSKGVAKGGFFLAVLVFTAIML